jgi:5'/3'-nucleotidase SurE
MANLLLTNDDGIDYPIFKRLHEGLLKAGHTVYAVAPAQDQSWISSAITARSEVVCEKRAERSWAIHGTPADCPAVALHLLEGIKIDAIVSGINVGDNTHLPMVISSGTVGAATVGALAFKTHSIAFSLATGPKYYAEAKKYGGLIPGFENSTNDIITLAAKRIDRLLKEEKVFGRVYNVNFPVGSTLKTPWTQTPLAISPIQQLFNKLPNGNFKHYPIFDEPLNTGENERTVIARNEISESVLDWVGINAPAPACVSAAL